MQKLSRYGEALRPLDSNSIRKDRQGGGHHGDNGGTPDNDTGVTDGTGGTDGGSCDTGGTGGTGSIPPHISLSQILAYKACPKQYKYSHVDKVPRRPSGAMAYGSALHQVTYSHLLKPSSRLFHLLPCTRLSPLTKKIEEAMVIHLRCKDWLSQWQHSMRHGSHKTASR